MEIGLGMIVRTDDGTIGIVRRVVTCNEVRFYRLQTFAIMEWGLQLTSGLRFVSDSEIVDIKTTTPEAEAPSAA